MLRLSRASILRAITLAGALCVAAIASPAPASAGTYTINFCNTSASHSFYGWTESETQGTSGGIPFFWGPSNDCGNNGTYVRFEVNTVPQSTAFDWTFTAPLDTTIEHTYFQGSASPTVGGIARWRRIARSRAGESASLPPMSFACCWDSGRSHQAQFMRVCRGKDISRW